MVNKSSITSVLLVFISKSVVFVFMMVCSREFLGVGRSQGLKNILQFLTPSQHFSFKLRAFLELV